MKTRLISISVLSALFIAQVAYAGEGVSVVTDPAKLRNITDTGRSDSARVNDFIPQEDGTVIDKRTGLQWMRCALGQKWTGKTCTGQAKEYTYQQGQQAPESFAGYNDWRVPTRFELETLVYCSSSKDNGRDNSTKQLPHYLKGCVGNYQRPTIVEQAFPNSPIWFWSASPFAHLESRAWSVEFDSGSDYSTGKDDLYSIRAVRNSQ
ncbi:MAG: hypothetical protein CSA42_08280 [Gammaproteobacteria bacterium]|nr:MAG: hypothetical protein CSA42_08280 [Gammaproteobacteria bacterium]